MCLEKVLCAHIRCEIFDDKLRILTARLKEWSVYMIGRKGIAYNDNTLSKTTGPIASNEADPVPLTINALAKRQLGVQPHANAEIQFETWLRDLQ